MFRQLLGAAFAAPLFVIPALAHDWVAIGDLEISDGFARATLPNAPVGGGYLTITNTGSEDDALVSVSSPVAGEVKIHEMKMDGDVMKMGGMPDGIAIPAGQTVTLEPGGLHLMFMDLKQPLVEDEAVVVTLTFAKAGTTEFQLIVSGPSADMPEH